MIEKGALVNSHRRLSREHGVLLDARADRDRRLSLPGAGLQADPRRGDRVLPGRRPSARRSSCRLYERVLEVRGGHGDFTVVTTQGCPRGAQHRRLDRLLRPAEPDERARRGPAEGDPLLPRALSRTCGRRSRSSARSNSAAKAALDCYRHGAQVTMIVRSPALSDKIKYWIRPDLENRIKEGSIKALFNATVLEIRDGSLLRRDRRKACTEIENDWVLATTGYHPDYGFLERLGLEFQRRRLPHARRTTRRRSRRPARASTSRERSAAAIRRAAGSSRTAASTRAKSPGTSPAAGPSGCSSRRFTGRRKSSRVSQLPAASYQPVTAGPLLNWQLESGS